MLNLAQGTRLTQLARRLLTSHLPHISARDKKDFSMHYGCFVTLRQGERITGTAGVVRTDLPLIDVLTHAAKHAKNDPRVEGRKAAKESTIEVCVVIPPKRIDVHSPSEYPQRIPPRHGVLVKGTYGEGYILPQMAMAQQMDALAMLRSASQGAQLRPDDWQDFDKATVYSFPVQIFGENTPGGDILQVM